MTWPIDVQFGTNGQLRFSIFDRPLDIKRVNPGTAIFRLGDGEEDDRLVGVAESATTVRFVPVMGSLPLLVFPRPRLLCPAYQQMRCVMQLPLHLRVGMGTGANMQFIEDITPPDVARAVYGPVDAGIICTSVKAPTAASVEELQAINSPANARASQFRILDEGGQKTGDGEDDPQVQTPPGPELVAYASTRIFNATDSPMEVTKIMVPLANLVLFQRDDRLSTSEIQLKIISKQEAELDLGDCPDAEATPIADLFGQPTMHEKKTHIFAFSYHQKTGLEYGF